MDRHYFKKTIKEDKFFKFCKENGADYMENGEGVWMKPKISINNKGQTCTQRIALLLRPTGATTKGKVNESWLNFEQSDSEVCQESQKWLISTMTKFQKWVPAK